MAFNSVGRSFIKAGGTTWAWVYFNGVFQSDRGAQWIMAHPEMNTGYYPEFGVAELQVSHQRKKIFFSSDTGGQYITYHCLVTNVQQRNTIFSIQGGGNV